VCSCVLRALTPFLNIGWLFLIRFGFYQKKITKLNFFLKKKPKPNRNRVKPTCFGSVRFFRAKPVQTSLARFFRFWLGFLSFGSVFSGLARFFRFGSVLARFFRFGSVWLGFFPVFYRFRFGFSIFGYKTETEPNRPVFSKI